jgi:hypothetical protein
MVSPKKPPARKDQPRPSAALSRLREALRLDDEDWQSYLWHARRGFSDFERANLGDSGSVLRLRDVPASWFENRNAIGYVALRVFKEGAASLGLPVAEHLLQICDPGPDYHSIIPGIGPAWLHLARAGLAPPIEPARLIHLALDMPKDFFHGVAEDDLPALCRLIMEGQRSIDAWDLHTAMAAVDAARIHVRAPFRLFENLMAVDWISAEAKREFCRGLLECRAETQRLEERRKAVITTFGTDFERLMQVPWVWRDLGNVGLGSKLRTLSRHAVYALVENIGEPLPEVIDEFFLRSYPNQEHTEAVAEGILDLIGLHAQELGPDAVRRLINKAIKHGLAPVRQAAYRIGAEQFGLEFARPALKDDTRLVRDWATKLLATKKLQPARKTRSKRRTPSSPIQ